MSAPQQRPTVGRIVHYNLKGRCFPAIVCYVGVHVDGHDVVDLELFGITPANPWDKLAYRVKEGLPSDEERWHWPERAS